ncbi:MAG: DUF4479 domain-containing protein [Erysipelotrichaceae bacterium]|nr:DUF4479 domain-containing protein [Erysipelotrichaceae bacterium]
MIDKYCLYYSYKSIGDVLLIDFSDDLPMSATQRFHDIEVIYHDDQIIGYNIFNISKIIKIKTKGLIYLPSHLFIDVINSILSNAKLPLLNYPASSGYVIGQIKSIQPEDHNDFINIDISDKRVTATLQKDTIAVGDKVVVALVGTSLSNGQVVHAEKSRLGMINSHICTFIELNLSESQNIYIVDEDGVIGNDFFQIGEEENE